MFGIFHNETFFFKKKRKQKRGWMEEEIEIASICNLFYRKYFYFNTSVLKNP